MAPDANHPVQSPEDLEASLRALPKVHLHIHLEGALRLSTLHELATALAPTVPSLRAILPSFSDSQDDPENQEAVGNPGCAEGGCGPESPKGNSNGENRSKGATGNLSLYREAFCITSPATSLTAFVDKFWATQCLLISYQVLERIAYETSLDAFVRDGVVLLELRYSPQYIALSHWNDHSGVGNFQLIHEAVTKGCQRAVDEVARDHGGLLAVGLLVTLDRSRSVEEAAEVVWGVQGFRLKEWEREQQERATLLTASRSRADTNGDVDFPPRVRIVGFDIAGDELVHPLDPFEDIFKSLVPNLHKSGKFSSDEEAVVLTDSNSDAQCSMSTTRKEEVLPPLGITIHAGEVPGSADSVLKAVNEFDVRRIGHGIHIVNSAAALQAVLNKDVLLELSPVSNFLTGSIGPSYDDHPIRQLWKRGVKCSISTDDPGIFDTDLVQEYMMLHERHGFAKDDFVSMNLDALRASFVHEDIKARIMLRYFL